MSMHRSLLCAALGAALCGFAAVALAAPPAQHPGDLGAQVKNVNAQIAAARTQNTALQAQVAQLEQQSTARQQQLKQRDAKIAALKQQLQAAGAPVSAASASSTPSAATSGP